MLQTAISLVSIDQAKLNLETEMKPFGWDFDAVKNNARDVWNKLLSKIEVEGGTEVNKKKFYTNLYRSYCARTIWSDVNRYIQSAALNGKKLTRPWFYHSELVKGGKLTLEMGDKPNMDWGSKPEDAPPSMSDTD